MPEDKTIPIGDNLWIVEDGRTFLLLRDSVGGETVIDIEEELVPLIDALHVIRVARNIK